MNRLIVATTNPGKIREIQAALHSLVDWSAEALPAGLLEVEETGATFLDNAVLKAVHYSRFGAAITVADDSGLSVTALAGRPGVHSARYGPTAEARNQRLLGELKEMESADRSARFFCALAVAQSGRVLWTTEKYLDGRITEQPAGLKGFGYDPIFFVPAIGKTMAEMTTVEKNHTSARGQALVDLQHFLASR